MDFGNPSTFFNYAVNWNIYSVRFYFRGRFWDGLVLGKNG
jgi:hypothetical protein